MEGGVEVAVDDGEVWALREAAGDGKIEAVIDFLDGKAALEPPGNKWD
jgi:hypothetical protein